MIISNLIITSNPFQMIIELHLPICLKGCKQPFRKIRQTSTCFPCRTEFNKKIELICNKVSETQCLKQKETYIQQAG